jgi:hypothetical protein
VDDEPRHSDRGVLAELRDPQRQTFYLVGSPRGKIKQYEKKWLELPRRKVRDSVEVKLFARDGQMYVLAKSEGRRDKEMAIWRRNCGTATLCCGPTSAAEIQQCYGIALFN